MVCAKFVMAIITISAAITTYPVASTPVFYARMLRKFLLCRDVDLIYGNGLRVLGGGAGYIYV